MTTVVETATDVEAMLADSGETATFAGSAATDKTFGAIYRAPGVSAQGIRMTAPEMSIATAKIAVLGLAIGSVVTLKAGDFTIRDFDQSEDTAITIVTLEAT